MTTLWPNYRTATNPAMTQQLQSGIHWRGVVDPKRSASEILLESGVQTKQHTA